MLRIVLGAKLHKARVTSRSVEYEGSLEVDQDLLDKVDMIPGERIDVYNITNGARFSTYLLSGERGKRVVSVKGAAARLCEVGDEVIIAAYRMVDETEVRTFKPRTAILDERNEPVSS